MMPRGLFAAALALTAVMSHTAPAIAADRWIDVRSAHFAITANASEGGTKALAWQLEQVRSEPKPVQLSSRSTWTSRSSVKASRSRQ